MDPLARIILYEMRFYTSWAQWNSLRRSLAMYDALSNRDRAWLTRFSVPTHAMKIAGVSILKRFTATPDQLFDQWIKYLDPSAVALAALSLISEPVNRSWAPPPKPLEAVMAAVRTRGAVEANREIARWGAVSFGMFLRIFRDFPEGVSEPLARLGQSLGIQAPPPGAAGAEVLRSVLLINDALPADAAIEDGRSERALSPQTAAALLTPFVQLHKGEPGRWRDGLLSRFPQRLAAENPAVLRPHLTALLEAGIFTPPFIFSDSPPDVIARLQQLSSDKSHGGYAQAALAAAKRPPLDDPDSPRISDDCRALPERKRANLPSSDHSVRAVVDDVKLPCPRCTRTLVALFDLQLTSPELRSYTSRLPPSAAASGFQRLRIIACEQCSGEGIQVFAALSPTGDIIPDSIVLRDPMEERHSGPGAQFRSESIQTVKPDPHRGWERDAIIFDPLPRQPIAPLVYALGYGGSSHIGGFPKWTQDDEFPACPACNHTMPFLGHLSELDIGGGDADLFAFWCPTCMTTAVIPQQS